MWDIQAQEGQTRLAHTNGIQLWAKTLCWGACTALLACGAADFDEQPGVEALSTSTLNGADEAATPYNGKEVDRCMGKTVPGATGWVKYGDQGMYVDVDTSACGYQAAPIYSTALGGQEGHEEALGPSAIYRATPKGFRIYLRTAATPEDAEAKRWHVNWQADPKGQDPCIGQTAVGRTNWKDYKKHAVYLDVDTSTCHRAYPDSAQRPLYFASLGGRTRHWMATGQSAIYHPQQDKFRLYITFRGLTAAKANAWGWHVNWQATGRADSKPNMCTGTSASKWRPHEDEPGVYVSDVDTSACGFGDATPQYFTSIEGRGHWRTTGSNAIYSPSPTGFQIRVRANEINIDSLRVNWRAIPAGAHAPGPKFPQIRFEQLEPAGDFTTQRVYAMSKDASAIVGLKFGKDGKGGYLWTKAQGAVDLATLIFAQERRPEQFLRVIPQAVSNNKIVAGRVSLAGPRETGFVWSEKGGRIDLPREGFAFTSPTHISDDGGVVAGVRGGTAHTAKSMFVWTNARGMQPIGEGQIISISANGSEVVYRREIAKDKYHLYTWSPRLGEVPVSEFNEAVRHADHFTLIFPTAVSDNKSVVAGSVSVGDFQQAFRWRTGGKLKVLSKGLSAVNAMSANGRTTAGFVGFRTTEGILWNANGRELRPTNENWSSITNIKAVSGDGFVFAGEGLSDLPGGSAWVARVALARDKQE